MAGEIDVSQVDGLLRRNYEKKLRDVRPASSVFQRRLSFEEGARTGEDYRLHVAVTLPAGFTMAGSDGGVKTLKAAKNMVIKQTSIKPFEIDLREQVAWAALTRAASEGDAAVKALTGEIVTGMQKAAANRLEAVICHGQRGLGIVESVTDLGSSKAKIKITAKTWAPGLWWALGINTTIDSFTSTTKNNGSGVLTVTAIDSPNRTITVSYSGSVASECQTDDVLYFEGSYDGTDFFEMPSIMAGAANTSGSYAGLSAATYPNWQGNTADVGGPISWGYVEEVMAVMRDRGAEGKLSLYGSNKFYAALVQELMALRIIQDSGSAKMGHKSVSFESAEVGDIEIIRHPFFKWGEFFVSSDDDCVRSGSSDITFGLPGLGKLVHYIQDKNAGEMGIFSDQFVLHKSPSHSFLGTGVTY